MKDFWKMLLAVICGMLIFGFISLFITISALNASVSAAEGAKTVLPRSGVLAIDMSAFKIDEQKNPVSTYESGVVIPSVGILQATRALKIAANDPGVKLIFLKTDGNLSSMASLEEFRKALDNFRQVSGKPVISYIESPTTGGYWLASVADKVYMTEYQGGLITMNGISVRSVFMKDMLDRLGVNMQLIRHGKYKSAGEMFTRSSSSPENTHQYQEMVNSMWATMRADIAVSRGISEKALDAAINNLSLCLPEDFLKENLADELFTREELKEKLADLSVVDSYKEVQFMRFSDYVTARVLTNFKSKEKIAIIYANGSIVDGRDINNISGDRFASIIDKVRADSTVKAVVLRVNSPGGSALASEKIKHELDLLGAEKPLVASYGDYAASGGYWISNNCSKIYTDAVCLTGSIGVFGMVPDFSKTTFISSVSLSLRDISSAFVQNCSSSTLFAA
jgi:protease-4